MLCACAAASSAWVYKELCLSLRVVVQAAATGKPRTAGKSRMAPAVRAFTPPLHRQRSASPDPMSLDVPDAPPRYAEQPASLRTVPPRSQSR